MSSYVEDLAKRIEKEILSVISDEIERYDRLTDEYIDIPLDSASYNIVSQSLRSVRDRIKDRVKAWHL